MGSYASAPFLLTSLWVGLALYSCADRIVGCEWWVHSKAARSRALGHQMHFDTEEGVLHAEGAVVSES